MDINDFMNHYKNPTYKEILEMISEGKKPMMFYHIPKEEIINKDFSGIDQLLNTVQLVGKGAKKSLIITCDGYDDVTDELYEIEEVREFVDGLFNRYPHILYYINSQFEADRWLISSYADEVQSIRKIGDRLTGDELFDKYVKNLEEVPTHQAHLTFHDKKLDKILKAIIKHGKIKKDANGSKKIAIDYALQFDNAQSTLAYLKISEDDLRNLGFK